jgi:hypothetical protein
VEFFDKFGASNTFYAIIFKRTSALALQTCTTLNWFKKQKLVDGNKLGHFFRIKA